MLLGLAACGHPPDVSVALVTRQTLEHWITTNGTVEPIDPFVIRARLATFVTRVPAVNGESVTKGQLLMDLDTSSASAQLAQARRNLLAAQQQLQFAQEGGPPDQVAQLDSDLLKAGATRDRLAAAQKSLQSLVAQQAATPEELAQNALQLRQAEANLGYLQQKKKDIARQAQYEASAARLQIDQAQAQIDDLSQQVASAHIVAPADGTVYALPVKAGDYVHVGDPLVSVANLHDVRVRAYVDEVDLGLIEPNQMVEVQWDGLPGRTWVGRTRVIPKQVIAYEDRRVGEVLCSVQNSGGQLLPNTNVDVQILAGRQVDTLALPRAAVQGQGNDRFVYLVQDNRLQLTPVTVGLASTEMLEIVRGLRQGDRVALPGSVNLDNGMKIDPVRVP